MTLDEFDLALFVFADTDQGSDFAARRAAKRFPHMTYKLQAIADGKTTVGVAIELRNFIAQLKNGPNTLLQREFREMIAESECPEDDD